ncbi:MAG TPA: Rv2231c family pyridoxal phosphate-dependent protein CobC [Mycobacteriales bacterium]|jgi:histidinol-phosphate aminotransferase|nr:Rv2231c family pyridoxal phosphate-dependent protein CobC [Mycobacteriales bacterium]
MDLRHHGDLEATPGLVDLAVNVRPDTPPAWLRRELAASLDDVGRYPDQSWARTAVAARHRRDPAEVLLTAGAAEAFVLLSRVLRPRHAVVIHPQFTEPEAALLAAGHPVDRVVLDWPFTLDPALVPDDADLVVIGNPTNPTSVLHPAATVAALTRPGRILVVDEAFADCIPGEPESLAGQALPGLVVVRSLTKTWGLAGLRCGYLLAPAELVAALAEAQPLWPVSTPALTACIACSRPQALAEADTWATGMAADRAVLLDVLSGHDVDVVPDPAASFVLLRHRSDSGLRERLRGKGFAARRGDTFPGLGPAWLRIAVRGPEVSAAFGVALGAVL